MIPPDATEAHPNALRAVLQARLLDSLGDAVIATGLDGRVIFWNRAAEALYGWSAAEAVGRPITELTPAEQSREQAEAVLAALMRGDRWEGEMQLRRRDGTTFLAYVHDSPVHDSDGQLVGIVGISADSGERQAREEALREETRIVGTLERIGGVLARELDLQRIVQTVTDEATALTRAQFGAFFYNVLNAKGESYTLYTISGVPREAFSKFPMPRNTHVFEPTFRGTNGGVVRSDDITKDPRYGHMAPHHGMPPGHLPVVSYLAVSVVSANGTVLGGLFFGHEQAGVFGEREERLAQGIAGWAAVAMDNARLYQEAQGARERAEAALREAEEANLAKMQFLTVMSHELRTPLNAIAGYADLLAMGVRGPVNDAQREDLERIRRSQRHLLSLINDVLNFAKLEAGHVRLDVRPVRLRDVVREVETLIAPQLAARGHRFAPPRDVDGVVVRADEEKVRQILLNLLSNAVKFTEPGGTIALSCGTDGERALVTVSDSGIGIPADKLDRVFEPFVQLDRGYTSVSEGTGLGLAISRDLARLMGGDLVATSEPGRGSTFTLSLPAGAHAE